MTKVLTFKVEIEELENKIWRKIEIADRMTVADLAYTILATFDSLAYHLYDIIHMNDRYDCMIEPLDLGDYTFKDAVNTKLRDVDFEKDNTMIMEYDFGSTTTFNITYLESREYNEYKGYLYPNIVDGQGRGMLDDMTDFGLKEIVDDIDEKGYSEHYVTPGYERHEKYDYRKFNVKTNNKNLKGIILLIKNGYEAGE